MHPLVVRASLALTVAALALACAGNSPLSVGPGGPPLTADHTLATNATIRYVGIEGGCWAIVTSQGEYEPEGLPPQFRVDGLKVYAVVRGDPTAVSTCMFAPSVTVDSIRTR